MSDARQAKDEVSRRAFLSRAGEVTLATCLIGTSAGALRFAVPNVETGTVKRLCLGMLSDFKMGTVTWLGEHELFVLRTTDGVGVFSSRCTHLGCTVRQAPSGFTCPCHGARFDPMGNVLKGPARRPLPWVAVRVEADHRLWVHLDEPVEVSTFTPTLLASARESP